MFTQISSKSVGETSKVNVKCVQKCETLNAVTINLAEVEIDVPDIVNNEIQLTDTLIRIILISIFSSFIDIDKEATKQSNFLLLVHR